MNRPSASDQLLPTGVIAVLRAPEAVAYRPVVQTLAEAGVVCVELTLTTPGTIDAIPGLRQALGPTVDIGVGTVLTVDDARAAVDAGATFLVTPNSNAVVMAMATDAGVPIYPGAMTPTEVRTNWAAGDAAVNCSRPLPLAPSTSTICAAPSRTSR